MAFSQYLNFSNNCPSLFPLKVTGECLIISHKKCSPKYWCLQLCPLLTTPWKYQLYLTIWNHYWLSYWWKYNAGMNLKTTTEVPCLMRISLLRISLLRFFKTISKICTMRKNLPKTFRVLKFRIYLLEFSSKNISQSVKTFLFYTKD